MSVIEVAVTILICIYLLRPMFYMYHVNGRKKIVLYCIVSEVRLHFCFMLHETTVIRRNHIAGILIQQFVAPFKRTSVSVDVF